VAAWARRRLLFKDGRVVQDVASGPRVAMATLGDA